MKLSPEDALISKQNHSRNENWRNVVTALIKFNAPPLPDTRELAKMKLLNLEARLKRNPEVYEEYRNFMNDYISQGHTSLVNLLQTT